MNLAQAEDSRDKEGRFLVEREHIKVTVDLLREFGNYMLKTQTMSPSKSAEASKIRYDDYKSKEELGKSPI